MIEYPPARTAQLHAAQTAASIAAIQPLLPCCYIVLEGCKCSGGGDTYLSMASPDMGQLQFVQLQLNYI